MDTISKARRSANMSAVRSKDMKPELVVRSTAHRMGYRFRLHHRELPGKPDLVFVGLRSIIFVHGCFWHQHRKRGCIDSRIPKSNRSYWAPKLARNAVRDRRQVASLRAMGWKVLVIWECETPNLARLQQRIGRFLSASNQRR